MATLALRRSTILAQARLARHGVNVGRSTTWTWKTLVGRCSAGEVAAEFVEKYRNYLNTILVDVATYPDLARTSWTDGVGTPVAQPWDSPFAHRAYFDHLVRAVKGDPAGVRGCVDKTTLEQVLVTLDMDLEESCATVTKSVAEGIIHAADKGGDDGCMTWPEYLNSLFAVGPASDSKAPDPTEPVTAPELTYYAAPGPSAPVRDRPTIYPRGARSEGDATGSGASGYVAPVVGAAIGGVGAVVMALPVAFVVGAAVVGALVGRWVGENATKVQEVPS